MVTDAGETETATGVAEAADAACGPLVPVPHPAIIIPSETDAKNPNCLFENGNKISSRPEKRPRLTPEMLNQPSRLAVTCATMEIAMQNYTMMRHNHRARETRRSIARPLPRPRACTLISTLSRERRSGWGIRVRIAVPLLCIHNPMFPDSGISNEEASPGGERSLDHLPPASLGKVLCDSSILWIRVHC
jgi:hypothetical protein